MGYFFRQVKYVSEKWEYFFVFLKEENKHAR